MKTLKTLILLVIAGTFLVFSSCKKDDDKSDPGKFTYDGTEYSLKGGFLEYFGPNSANDGYNLDLTFYTPEITVQEVLGFPYATGNGKVIYFWMYSSHSDGLATGNYVFDALSTEAAGTFVSGYLDTDPNNGVFVDFESGVVNVTRDGNNYEIDFDVIDIDGKNISGTFKGTLKYYDESETK
ncbi:MAG: hypothetical protein K9H64_11835 [Bacteroidales bacterium]|nr:hypothetical protein [Bacteroidales bacterium]MCF8456732.1 hypothetical protein [Bacteroidales bacterium]